MTEIHDFFLSRRPIVGADRRFMGWDLVLGSAEGADLSRASSTKNAYSEAFARLSAIDSWDTLLCGGRAVLHVDRPILFADAIESLPRNKVVLALPPDFEVDPQSTSRLHTLHRQRGMRLLFDQYVRKDPREEVLDLADFVHVDTQNGDEASQTTLVRRAKRRDLAVLARDVDHESDLQHLCGLGFDYFLGQHYAEAGASDESIANVDGRSLLKLMLDSRAGLDISEVAQQVNAQANLRDGLLQLVNGLELARAQKIESIQQALIMIGVDGLGRWLNLLLFRYGAAGGERGPLFRVAASRARLMELLVTDGVFDDPQRKATGETAFLVGMLSFVHVLLGVDRAAAVESFGLPEELRQALVDYKGPIGRLLWLAENLDAGRFLEVAEIVSELSVDPARLWQHQRDAYGWVYRMV